MENHRNNTENFEWLRAIVENVVSEQNMTRTPSRFSAGSGNGTFAGVPDGKGISRLYRQMNELDWRNNMI